MNEHLSDLNPEYRHLGERLQAERPVATAAELDAMETRARYQARRRHGQPAAGFLRTRLAITATLVAGLLMTTGGAAVGVTGLSGDGQSATAQYQKPCPPGQQKPKNGNGKGPEKKCGPRGGTLGGQQPGGGVAGAVGGASAGGGGAQGAQAGGQGSVSGRNSSLPFTGLVAIPLLLGGLAMLGTGAVLRRRARA